MLNAFAITHPGLVRPTNEDSVICNAALRLFAVADGMGGHSAGEVASRIAVEAIESFVGRSYGEDQASWPYGLEPGLSLDANRLRNAILLANRGVHRAADTDDEYNGMGTTVVAALVSGGRLVVGHVGDSRLYLWRSGLLATLTEDDSWVATVLARDPDADEETLARHPMRHVLTSVLGARETVDVHLVERILEPGDLILLTSDGLHGLVDAAAIGERLAADTSIETRAGNLVQAALDRGGGDNVTVVLVEYTGQP